MSESSPTLLHRVTVENALAWATLPAGATVGSWPFRLSAVRCFATYLHALDPPDEIPPAGLLPHPYRNLARTGMRVG